MNVSRILAPNPSIYTGPGTNTYVLESEGECLVVDPGPRIGTHESAIRRQTETWKAAAVIVTHTHPDHAPLANPLATSLGVPALGHAPGPEFVPDEILEDGATLGFGAETLKVIHTPGHSWDHLCFLAGETLFSGDHIMGGSTVVVEDLIAYLSSLDRLKRLAISRIHPGHGDVIEDPDGVIDEYIEHRRQREEEVLAAVGGGAGTLGEIVRSVYADVPEELHQLAACSVSAHLKKLATEGVVSMGDWEELWSATVTLLADD